MSLFHNQPPQFAMITGKWQASGSCTDVIGGTLTSVANAGASTGSTKITWEPAFISAPIIIATIDSGPKTVSSPVVRFTGVGTTTAYIAISDTGNAASGVTVGLIILGEARL